MESDSIDHHRSRRDPSDQYIRNDGSAVFDLSGTHSRSIGNAEAIFQEHFTDTLGTRPSVWRALSRRVARELPRLNLSNSPKTYLTLTGRLMSVLKSRWVIDIKLRQDR